ncbi:MAG: 2,3,4,5-tetrahydropyridine-2,6-dicarboxylate N-acetyltransferase [Oscillospiraceae bacterium]|nr:2,3,4,5-tetrahydropyridine-2,6-dicarboxylate N-acetyltransferase [Oscillospiraceae bacterium]
MDAYEIIEYIRSSPKKTPVRVWLQLSQPVEFPGAQQFLGGGGFSVVFGDWEEIGPVLEKNRDKILSQQVENDARNSAIPLLDKKNIHARIEPGAIIREQVQIGDNAVIMMGAILNIGAVVGEGTMIDMGAILGGRAMVGRRCHIGAGAVLAGVVEPPSATPVIVEDNVLVGANAVVIEGVRIGEGAIVAAGSVVIEDVAPGMVVAGVPARVIKKKDEKSIQKTELIDALRELGQ